MPARSDPHREKLRPTKASATPRKTTKQADPSHGSIGGKSGKTVAKAQSSKTEIDQAGKRPSFDVTFKKTAKENGFIALGPAGSTRAVLTTTRAAASSQSKIRTDVVTAGGHESGKSNGRMVKSSAFQLDESEPFMNERQRTYFRNKLLSWKDDIVRQNQETLTGLHEDSAQFADVADRATSETDRALELRARDRQRKLMGKIDAALSRIEEGTYGYCEETGEPISLKRLDARPIATMSLEAQERKERLERVFRED